MQYGIAPPNFRLPDDTHLGGTRLLVSDLERSLDYYQRLIGLRVLSREKSQATLGVANDRALLYLETRPGAVTPPRGGRLGLYHFAILVPDRGSLGRFARHLVGSGVHFASADHGVSEALYLWDPDRLGIEVYADKPRTAWRLRGQEIYMTTEPLDIDDVLAAGGDEPWAGLPYGTTLGHMHLQIGDLERAEAFYHRALGFDKIVWKFPGALFLSAGGYHHHLGTNIWAAAATQARENEARLLEWAIVVPSEDARDRAAESCRAAGYRVERQDRSWRVADPWDIHVRLI